MMSVGANLTANVTLVGPDQEGHFPLHEYEDDPNFLPDNCPEYDESGDLLLDRLREEEVHQREIVVPLPIKKRV